MRRLPLAPDGPRDDDVTVHPSRPIVPSGATIVVVPVDETSALAFVESLARTFASVGATPTFVFETESTSVPLPEVLHAPTFRCALVPNDPSALARELAGNGPFVVVGARAASVIEASHVVAITGGRVAFLHASFRAIRDRVDSWLEEPRPAFAEWLARRATRPSG